MEILKNPNPLQKNYVPQKIIDREEQKKLFKNFIIRPIEKGLVPDPIYCYGGTGTGKTATLRRLFKENMDKIKRYNPKVEYIYVNMGDMGVPSFYSLVVTINKKLSKYLPVGQINKIYTKGGWDTNNQLNAMKKIVREKELNLIILIDEVDRCVKYKHADEPTRVFRVFTRNTKLNKDSVGITSLFVTNDVGLASMIPTDDSQRMDNISFPRYDFSTLLDILKYHSKLALKEDTYTEKDLEKIVKWVYNRGNKSARELKSILQYVVQYSESEGLDQIDTSDLKLIQEKKEKSQVEKEILRLPGIKKIILLSVVKANRIATRDDKSKKMGLKPYVKYPTGRIIYSKFKKIFKQVFGRNKEPIVYRTFQNKVDDLEREGLLMKEVKSLGRAKGLTSLIYATSLVKEFESEIKESLGLV